MRAVCYSSAPAAAWNQTPARTLAWPSIRLKLMAVAVATILAAGFRVGALSTYGLSEDELNKVHALEQYRAGHFSDNAEHPMLMKLAMWASSGTATAWNRIVSPDRAVSLETAIRLPNALAGAATTIVLFGVADLLFGGAVAVVVSLIWAFDVNAIAINRIGKEDTFLLLFFLTAVFCYERAKRTGTTNLGSARTWYTLSGAAFGLMLASKYMPHFLGIYALFNVLGDRRPGANKPDRLPHYAAMAAAFLMANPAILLPDTWRYLITYVRGDTLAHHGYLYAGALYVSDVPISPIGVPPGYYLRLLSTRVPMVVLAALLPGAIELVRRRRERGFALLRVLLVFLLVPYSLMAAKFLRYSLPMLATVDVIAAVGLVSGVTWLLRKQWLARTTRVGVASAAAAVFAGGLVAAPQTAAPFYSLFQNAIGERLDPGGAAFPEQTYDYGVRESMAAIAVVAKPRAVIITDAPAVASHYLRIDGRPDVAVRSLSAAGTASGAHEAWIVVQSEHATFENEPVVERLRARETPWTEIRMAGVVAVQVFRREGR